MCGAVQWCTVHCVTYCTDKVEKRIESRELKQKNLCRTHVGTCKITFWRILLYRRGAKGKRYGIPHPITNNRRNHTRSGVRSCPMARCTGRWIECTVPKGTEYYRILPNGTEWYRMVPIGTVRKIVRGDSPGTGKDRGAFCFTVYGEQRLVGVVWCAVRCGWGRVGWVGLGGAGWVCVLGAFPPRSPGQRGAVGRQGLGPVVLWRMSMSTAGRRSRGGVSTTTAARELVGRLCVTARRPRRHTAARSAWRGRGRAWRRRSKTPSR